MLAALGMNLDAVGTDLERLTKVAKAVNDSAVLVQELSQESARFPTCSIRPCWMRLGLPPLFAGTSMVRATEPDSCGFGVP